MEQHAQSESKESLSQPKRIVLQVADRIYRSIYFLATYFGRILIDKSMPVWLTLSLMGAGVWATYILTPQFNAKFENNKIRSSYIIDNLKTITHDTGQLFSKIGSVNRILLDGDMPDRYLIEEIQSNITVLQWKALEYDIIFDDQVSKLVINDYRSNLEDLRKAVDSANSKEDVERVLLAARGFVASSHEVLKILSAKADIKIDLAPLVGL